jgi:hypothetical protein
MILFKTGRKFTVSEAAAACDLTEKTLRNWIDRKIVAPTREKRSTSIGFTAAQILGIQVLINLQDMGIDPASSSLIAQSCADYYRKLVGYDNADAPFCVYAQRRKNTRTPTWDIAPSRPPLPKDLAAEAAPIELEESFTGITIGVSAIASDVHKNLLRIALGESEKSE